MKYYNDELVKSVIDRTVEQGLKITRDGWYMVPFVGMMTRDQYFDWVIDQVKTVESDFTNT